MMTSARGVELQAGFRAIATDAVEFWERGRLIYNAVLATIVGMWIILLGVPAFFSVVTLAPSLLMLAIGANVLYSLAYPADILVQHSAFRGVWRHVRWGVLLIGVLAASWLALGVLWAMWGGMGF